MSEVALRTQGLGKAFQIGRQDRYGTLRDSMVSAMSATFWWSPRSEAESTFWALRNVSFEMKQGAVLGIVGKNGAGKSTLLKVLSRITRPTEGFAEVHGRVASLLEVGTGFHGELTGRENIFLNGAILGMRRAEVQRKFDEIVDFSGVEKFIDTPVKRYSSGMYLRLAFAVAAHIEPDILIVDEVLAVGDMEFQRRCLGRLKSISDGGRTVLFVSHNLQAVRALCDEVIVLAGGTIRFRGAPERAVREYVAESGRTSTSEGVEPDVTANIADKVRLTAVRFLEETADVPCVNVQRGRRFRIRLSVSVRTRIANGDVSFAVMSALSVPLFSETLRDQEGRLDLEPGDHDFDVLVDAGFLKTEPYSLEAFVTEDGRVLDRIGGVPLPEIDDESADQLQEARRWGLVRIPVRWTRLT